MELFKLREGYLTKNFTIKELSCPCGDCNSIYDYDFVTLLQAMRTRLCKPLKINSGYRCEMYNRKIGGSHLSMHMKGCAADIAIDGWSAKQKYDLLNLAFGMGFVGIAQSEKFVHVDLRSGALSTWIYTVQSLRGFSNRD